MHVALTAIGADRPGIVAAVTRVLYEQGANIEDSRMAIIGGHFSMMLMLALPDGVAASALEDALGATAAELGLIVAVRPVSDPAIAPAGGEPWVLSVYGADKPGIVYRVTDALASRGVNVTDLMTHVVEREDGPPLYVMIIEATLPRGSDAAALERDLKALGVDLDIDVSLHPAEGDTL